MFFNLIVNKYYLQLPVQSKKEHEETKVKLEESRLENEKVTSQLKESRERLTSLQREYDRAWGEIDTLKCM